MHGVAKVSTRRGAAPVHGVLAEVAQKGTLPFTGVALPSFVAAAVVLCLAGTSLKRSRSEMIDS